MLQQRGGIYELENPEDCRDRPGRGNQLLRLRRLEVVDSVSIPAVQPAFTAGLDATGPGA